MPLRHAARPYDGTRVRNGDGSHFPRKACGRVLLHDGGWAVGRGRCRPGIEQFMQGVSPTGAAGVPPARVAHVSVITSSKERTRSRPWPFFADGLPARRWRFQSAGRRDLSDCHNSSAVCLQHTDTNILAIVREALARRAVRLVCACGIVRCQAETPDKFPANP